ncbi:lysM domain receptor-like kinase 3 [Nicotiana tabacum]|uniref:LysM domain receptor-like kinase 3 n=2 Tax=Nicotiana TaxID=4085 RepID=A0A1S3ZMY3_TOBAC|nr:PREDICTED: lysM domain receptor-like kinase 3 [Nicotiana sylvestris]XP_016465736.1 PREDICTED: lysM domain receptor-like kinase 3 [Nicotiana tabacum]
MCRTKMAVDAAQPIPSPSTRSGSPTTPKGSSSRHPQSLSSATSTQPPKSPVPHSGPSNSSNRISYNSNSNSGSEYRLDTSVATTSVSSQASLSSFRSSLPDNPQVYDFADIRAATNNFLAKRYSSTSSSQSWRCTLRGKDVIIFQRRIQKSMEKSELRAKLSVICRSHYRSIIKLLGASISGDHIYLVYDFVAGCNLSLCLRNPKNPSYTVLSTWMSRMQIATDVAHGLDYIHNTTGLDIKPVHKYVKSSGIIVTEPSFNAKICHFGAAELCSVTESKVVTSGGEIGEELSADSPPERRASKTREFEGVRGYMSPEFQLTGVATQKSDVYTFGVVLLELFSGEEPVRYKYDKATGNYRKISVIETATEAVECGGDVEDDGGVGVERRLRKWVDGRLRDSFPVEVAQKVMRLALDCVHVEPDDRPDMRRVAGKISKLYLESKFWSDRVKMPTEISVSLAPR